MIVTPLKIILLELEYSLDVTILFLYIRKVWKAGEHLTLRRSYSNLKPEHFMKES